MGDIRVLYDLDEALFFILTGLTHRDGLQYNLAMVFLVDEADPTKLVCRFAIGQIEPAQWQAEMDRRKDEGLLDLDMLLKEFRADKQKYLRTPIMDRWKGCKVDIGAGDTNVIRATPRPSDTGRPWNPVPRSTSAGTSARRTCSAGSLRETSCSFRSRSRRN